MNKDDWVIVDQQRRSAFTPSDPSLTRSHHDRTAAPVIFNYFEQPYADTNPFAKPTRSPSLSPASVSTNSPAITAAIAPLDIDEPDVQIIHENLFAVLQSLKCKGTCPDPARCSCVRNSQDEIMASLERIAAVVESRPHLLDHPGLRDFSRSPSAGAMLGQFQPDQPTTSPQNRLESSPPQLTTNQPAHQSLILVPDSQKYPMPTNLDGFFHSDNLDRISLLITRLTSSAGRARGQLNSKSADLIRALPKSQSLQVVIGVLLIYYALPNSFGLAIVRRVFDLLIMQNILLMSSWNAVFEYLDESSGCRYSLVPL